MAVQQPHAQMWPTSGPVAHPYEYVPGPGPAQPATMPMPMMMSPQGQTQAASRRPVARKAVGQNSNGAQTPRPRPASIALGQPALQPVPQPQQHHQSRQQSQPYGHVQPLVNTLPLLSPQAASTQPHQVQPGHHPQQPQNVQYVQQQQHMVLQRASTMPMQVPMKTQGQHQMQRLYSPQPSTPTPRPQAQRTVSHASSSGGSNVSSAQTVFSSGGVRVGTPHTAVTTPTSPLVSPGGWQQQQQQRSSPPGARQTAPKTMPQANAGSVITCNHCKAGQ